MPHNHPRSRHTFILPENINLVATKTHRTMSDYPITPSIRAALHPSNMKGSEGKYYARVVGMRTLDTDALAHLACRRAGAYLTPEIIKAAVNAFFEEASLQMAGGNNVCTEWIKGQATVRGLFDGPHDTFDPDRHNVNFNIEPGRTMRQIFDEAEVVIDNGCKRYRSYIKSVCDHRTAATDTSLTPGGVAIVTGRNIKIAGDAPDIGLQFVDTATGMHYRATDIIANNPSSVEAVVPQLPPGRYVIEIITQYTHSRITPSLNTIVSTTPLCVDD